MFFIKKTTTLHIPWLGSISRSINPGGDDTTMYVDHAARAKWFKIEINCDGLQKGPFKDLGFQGYLTGSETATFKPKTGIAIVCNKCLHLGKTWLLVPIFSCALHIPQQDHPNSICPKIS
jgi:hypothetical protein